MAKEVKVDTHSARAVEEAAVAELHIAPVEAVVAHRGRPELAHIAAVAEEAAPEVGNQRRRWRLLLLPASESFRW